MEFGSQFEASRITGINNKDISNCCLGKRKTSGGFIWRFTPGQMNEIKTFELIKTVIKQRLWIND